MLIAFEAVAGLLVLIPGAIRQVALVALIGFHVALVSFGWGFFLWSVPMTSVLLLLLRADRRLTSVSAPRREMMTAA